jgi:gas vesicle structural protein
MAAAQGGSAYLARPQPSGLAEVIDIILDKGLVIDAYVRVSLIGIEILTIDARIVIASVDTYLRFAEAVNRLDLEAKSDSKGLPELMEDVTSGGSKSKTKGALEGAKEKVQDVVGSDDDDDDREKESRSRSRSSSSRSGSRSRSRSRSGDDE